MRSYFQFSDLDVCNWGHPKVPAMPHYRQLIGGNPDIQSTKSASPDFTSDFRGYSAPENRLALTAGVDPSQTPASPQSPPIHHPTLIHKQASQRTDTNTRHSHYHLQHGADTRGPSLPPPQNAPKDKEKKNPAQKRQGLSSV